MSSYCNVTVQQVPERLRQGTAHTFLQGLQQVLKRNRAYLVFDFSRTREIDSAGVGILLRCLEEVLKGNGDIKLAALPVEVAIILELTGVENLFEVFDTTNSAVASFQTFSGHNGGRMKKPEYSSFENGVSNFNPQMATGLPGVSQSGLSELGVSESGVSQPMEGS